MHEKSFSWWKPIMAVARWNGQVTPVSVFMITAGIARSTTNPHHHEAIRPTPADQRRVSGWASVPRLTPF
jgi:hypothetical protein